MVKEGLGSKVPRASKVVGRCSNLVAYFKRSSSSNSVLKEKQIALKLPEHALISDVPTRWNSTVAMIEHVLEQRIAIHATLIEVKRTDLYPKDDEFKDMESLMKLLQPFLKITETVSRNTFMHFATASSFNNLTYLLLEKVIAVLLNQ